jgi:hypothetical protein
MLDERKQQSVARRYRTAAAQPASISRVAAESFQLRSAGAFPTRIKCAPFKSCGSPPCQSRRSRFDKNAERAPGHMEPREKDCPRHHEDGRGCSAASHRQTILLRSPVRQVWPQGGALGVPGVRHIARADDTRHSRAVSTTGSSRLRHPAVRATAARSAPRLLPFADRPSAATFCRRGRAGARRSTLSRLCP